MGVEMKALKNTRIGNEKGLAILETVPLIVIFVLMISFGMGFFGIIHTAVLHSIAARTYAMETFRNRSNLYYYREDGSGIERPFNFTSKGWRFHAIMHESDSRDLFVATTRQISMGSSSPEGDSNKETHNQAIYQMGARNEKINASPAWIMVGYGICLNAGCGN
jgi:hypothetical protein